MTTTAAAVPANVINICLDAYCIRMKYYQKVASVLVTTECDTIWSRTTNDGHGSSCKINSVERTKKREQFETTTKIISIIMLSGFGRND